MEITAEEEKPGIKALARLGSEATFLAAVTLGGYLITWCYLRGQASELGVPSSLVRVSLEECLPVIVGLVMSCIGIVALTNLAMPVFGDDPSGPRKFVGTVGLIMTAMVGGFYERWFLVILIVPVFLMSVYLGFPALIRRYDWAVLKRIQGYVVDPNAKPEMPKDWLDTRLGIRVSWFVLGLFFSLFAAAGYGKFIADGRESYYATVSKPAEVLVATYGDVLVFRKVGSRAVIIRVLGKDNVPPLQPTHVGSMAVDGDPYVP